MSFLKKGIKDIGDSEYIMNKTVIKRTIAVAIAALTAMTVIYFIYMNIERHRGLEAIKAAEGSAAVLEKKEAAEEYLFRIRKAPVKIYFLDNEVQNESCFYGGRLYVPFEETYNGLVGLMDERAEDFGVIFDNFIFGGYGEDKINPYFLNVDGHCYISFYKLMKGMGLCCLFDSENDRVDVFYRKTDTSDAPKIVVSDDAKPALLRLEDITPDGYCSKPRYTDEGLEKLRAVGEYLESRGQRFYLAVIFRYVNPEQGIDVDLAGETNTYTADFLYTLDYLKDKGGMVVIHGYTHQYGDYFSADGFEFGCFSGLDMEEKARRLLIARTTAELLGYDCFRWEFPHYGASPSDIVMAEETYDVIFQSKNKLFRSDCIGQKKASDGRSVTYVPLPAYYLNNIYELDDMLKRIDKGEKKGNVVGLFFHPSIDFEDIIIESTPWGVRNWHYTPYKALPVIADKILADGYTFTEFEKYLY